MIAAATEGKDFGDDQEVVNEILAAAEHAEEESGYYLTEENEQGWQLYNKAVEVCDHKSVVYSDGQDWH